MKTFHQLRSINYGDDKPYYKNFVGPGPNIDPYELADKDGFKLRPLNITDASARVHDYGYFMKGATGVKGALLNLDVAYDDRRLAKAGALVFIMGLQGKKDPITNKSLMADPIQMTWSSSIAVVFGVISTVKIPLNTAQGYINNFRNSFTSAWGGTK